MSLPVQITFHGLPHSDSIEAYVHARADKLETFSQRITGCHVVVEAPHHHHQHGGHYRVRVDLVIPGDEIVVSRTPDEDRTSEDAYAAIDEAFDRASRRLLAYVRRRREPSGIRSGRMKRTG